jgi:hypothetical protein
LIAALVITVIRAERIMEFRPAGEKRAREVYGRREAEANSVRRDRRFGMSLDLRHGR